MKIDAKIFQKQILKMAPSKKKQTSSSRKSKTDTKSKPPKKAKTNKKKKSKTAKNPVASDEIIDISEVRGKLTKEMKDLG